MAKKTTRQRKELAQQRAVQQAVANVSTTMARPIGPGSTPSAAAPIPAAPDFSADYARVRADLRRIAILALAIIVVLVALSFVI